MTRAAILSAVASLALAACRGEGSATEPQDLPEQGEPPVSIIRDDVREEVGVGALGEPLVATRIVFPEGGAELDAQAIEALDKFMTPDWVDSDREVLLSGHSDAVGSDEANRAAGESRARAVAEYLEANGVRADRIRIVSLGEGNPVAPNYRPDGSDNPKGQALNRRVEILVKEAEATRIDEKVERVKGIEPSS